MSRKRFNRPPDMIVMASTQLQAINRLSLDPDTYITKKDDNSDHTLNYALYVLQVGYDVYFTIATRLYGHKKIRVTLSECSLVAY